MRTVVVIPSRIGSERLARKPLRHIHGVSLVERVWRQVMKATGIDAVYVATDSDEIHAHVMQFGGNAILTEPECANGTERVCQAVDRLEEQFDVVINVQGDEPLIAPEVITAVRDAFQKQNVDIATPISPLREAAELYSASVVKCAVAHDGNILYFSRAPIPFVRDRNNSVQEGVHWKHIGVYGFRKAVLMQLTSLPHSKLEQAEKLEQLRWLEHGYRIHAVEVEYTSVAVDTEEDVAAVERILTTR
jgi:3-deoxy-manno-octulosonate cytidylyltransferase (CMP-KDO synthetase)